MPRAFQFQGITFTKTGLLTLFTPASLGSNLVAWWEPDQTLTVNGSNQVTSWIDLSGAAITLGNSAPASSLVEALNVQNGLPMLSNAGGLTSGIGWVQTPAAVAATAFNSATPFSVAFVMKRLPALPGQANYPALVSNNITTSVIGWMVTAGGGATGGVANTIHLWMQSSGVLAACGSTPLISGVSYIVVVTYDGLNAANSIQVYINGIAETMTNTNNNLVAGAISNGPITIGGASANFRTADSLGSISLYKSKLTASQAAALSQSMNQRWAIY